MPIDPITGQEEGCNCAQCRRIREDHAARAALASIYPDDLAWVTMLGRMNASVMVDHIERVSGPVNAHRDCELCGDARLTRGRGLRNLYFIPERSPAMTVCADCLSGGTFHLCLSCHLYYFATQPDVSGCCPDCAVREWRAATEHLFSWNQRAIVEESTFPHFRTCRECGEVETLLRIGRDTPACQSCQENIDLCDCANCGDPYETAETLAVPVGNVCPDCYNEFWTTCTDCGETVRQNSVRTDEGDLRICPDCYDENYTYCERCDRLFHHEDMADGDYCRNCRDEVDEERMDEIIHEYGYRPFPIFHGNRAPGEAYMGLEIETQGDAAKQARAVRAHDNTENDVYCKHDGSVDLEMVTHPATLAEHRLQLPGLLSVLSQAGAKAHDAKDMSCGMHIHIERARFSHLQICKAWLAMNKCHKYWSKLARRTSDYASYEPTYNLGGILGRVRRERSSNRYRAINLQNRGTWEVRIFRSTLKATSALAYVESIHALCGWIKSRSCPGTAHLYRMDPETAWGTFVRYILTHKETYGDNLIPYLMSQNLMDQPVRQFRRAA